MVSNITNRIFPIVTELKNRPLKNTYSFVFMDAIHYKICEYKQIVVKAAYVVIGYVLDIIDKVNNLIYNLIQI